MKTIAFLLLLVSLAVNAALWRRSRDDAPAPARLLGEPTQAVAPAATSAGRSLRSKLPVETGASEGLNWSAFPTSDLAALAAHLKANGFPQHIVRGIISHYLYREYELRRKELLEDVGPVPYWKRNSFASMNLTQRAQLRALSRSHMDRLNEILGTSVEGVDEAAQQTMAQRYGSLPPETLQLLQSIEQDYSELNVEIRSESQGILFPADREKLALLEQERRKDILSVLTPEQFEEFELRTSPTSNTLRRSLVVMEPTEQEFRTLHRLQQAFDEKYSSMNARRTDPVFQQERQAAERDLFAAVKAELGEERGAEFEKSRDHNYVHAYSVAKQLDLPRETGDRLLQIQRKAFEEFPKVGTDPGLSPEQRSQVRVDYVNSLKASLISEIGEANLPVYQSGAGGWLWSTEQAALRGSGAASNRPISPPTPVGP